MLRHIFFAVCIVFIVFTAASAQELAAKEGVNYFNEGVKAQESFDFVRAFTSYQKVLLVYPQNTEYRKAVLSNLGAIFAQQGNFQKAETYLQEVLTIDPNFEPAKLNLGLIYERQPDRLKALEYWMIALERYKPKHFVISTIEAPQKQ